MEKYQQSLENLKKFQIFLQDYIDSEEDAKEKYDKLQQFVQNIKFGQDIHDLKLILHLISTIFKNQHRNNNFIGKFEQILQLFGEDIKRYFTNIEIFEIFKKNKRILLSLLDLKIFTIDERVASQMTHKKNNFLNLTEYFSPELKPFINSEVYNSLIINNEKDKDFLEKRLIGENDFTICKLIRDDSVEDFITYVHQNDIKLSSTIQKSIYETNFFLEKQNVDLIEYAAFFGSIKIFQYMKMNEVNLNSSLWNFAIHSRNPELICILENSKIKPEDETFQECLKESIKCHHNEIANYILDNDLLKGQNKENNLLNNAFRYYNFEFTSQEYIKISNFCYFVLSDYIDIVIDLLNYDTKECLAIMKLVKYDKYNKVTTEESSLPIAVRKNNIEIVQILLNSGKFFTNLPQIIKYYDRTERRSLLNIAYSNDNKEMVDLLLSLNKPNIYYKFLIIKNDKEKEESFLYTLVKDNNEEMIKKLLSLYHDINANDGLSIRSYPSYNKTPLLVAVENGNIEIVKLLLTAQNINVNFKSEYKSDDEEIYKITPLFAAVKNDNIEMVKLLLNCPNINVNIGYVYQTEPVLYQDTTFYFRGIKIDYGKEKSRRRITKIDGNCLTFLVEKKNIECIKLLLDNDNVDVNLPKRVTTVDASFPYDGWCTNHDVWFHTIAETPLIIAVEKNNKEIVKLLLANRKIDRNFKIEEKINGRFDISQRYELQLNSKTAYDIAKQNDNDEIINLF